MNHLVNNDMKTYKAKRLNFFITEASSIKHAAESFYTYRIYITEDEIEEFSGTIPKSAKVMTAIQKTDDEAIFMWYENLPTEKKLIKASRKQIREYWLRETKQIEYQKTDTEFVMKPNSKSKLDELIKGMLSSEKLEAVNLILKSDDFRFEIRGMVQDGGKYSEVDITEVKIVNSNVDFDGMNTVCGKVFEEVNCIVKPFNK